jgi:MSHA biogenesis protein MshN
MSLINQVLLDLEKRHASESELKSLPPYVRAVPGRPQSSIRMYLVAAIAVIVLVAIAAIIYVYESAHAPGNDVPQIISKPKVLPAPDPVPVPQKAEAPPSAEPPAQTAAFKPVSRLSDELSLIAPPVRNEKPAVAGRKAKPAVAIAIAQDVAVPQAEKLQAPAVEKPSKPDAPAKPDAPTQPHVPVAEPVTPPSPIAAADSTPAAIDKQMREVSPSERAEIAFRRGVTQIREGRANAAELEFRDALKQDPAHAGAGQALLGLLLDSGRNSEAEELLRKALELNPRQPRHAMVLARLEVERGEVTGAINTMVGALPYVQSDPGFYAFLAALLQREGRHREAADYYRTALRGSPGNGVWMMGLGISLRASNQSAEARDAFQHAIESKQLTPELQEFVERQLRELSASKKR